jgi:type I restriction enzyme M protein
MSEDQQKLFQKLWDIANILRGKMDAGEFKNYMLGFIFYKFLSEKLEAFINSELESDNITFDKACEDEEFKHELMEEILKQLGFFLEPQYLFRNLVAKAEKKEFILADLDKTLKNIEQSTLGQESEEDFIGLFDDVDLQSGKLGRSENDKNRTISEILKKLNQIDFNLHDSNVDVLGDAYEFLIGAFASDAGKKAGEFYTPQQVSKILAKLVTIYYWKR